jgi:type I restriction enzyme S subunit
MNSSLRELSDIEYGASPKEIRADDKTSIGIYGTGGFLGHATKSLFNGPLVVVARKGTLDNPLYVRGDCWVIDTVFAVLPKADVEAKWLYYQLLNYDLKKLNESTGVPSISREYLYRLSFKNPGSAQQRKIARILSAIDEVIGQTEETIEKLKKIKQGMMHDLFTRGINVKTGKLRPPSLDAPELYHETDLGWIPKEWDVDLLSEWFDTFAGGTPSRSMPEYFKGHIPWVSSTEVNAPKIYKTNEYITDDALRNSSAKLIKKGAVLIAMYGATAGQISRMMIEGASNQAVLALLAIRQDGIENDFIYHYLKFTRNKLIYLAQGSGQPNLSKEMIDRHKIVFVKSKNERDKIVQILDGIDAQIDSEKDCLLKRISLKQGLMQDLLTGKVEVAPDPQDKGVN